MNPIAGILVIAFLVWIWSDIKNTKITPDETDDIEDPTQHYLD